MRNYKVLFLLVALVLLCLCGCAEEPVSNHSPFTGRLKEMDMYIGTLPISKALPVLEFDRRDEACYYLGKSYQRVIALDEPGDNCYWQLDCSYLTAIAKTPSDETVYAIYEDEQLLSLLFVGADIYNLTCEWYLADAEAMLDLSSYRYDDFSIQDLSDERDNRFGHKTVWEYHTSQEELHVMMLLDGYPTFYLLFFRSNEHPWLVYQLPYQILENGELYIYNEHHKGMVLIDKTGDGSSS